MGDPRKKFISLALVSVLLLTILSGCLAQRVVNDWDTGVALYSQTEVEYNQCILTVWTANEKIDNAFGILEIFTQGNVALAEAWAEGQIANDQMAEQQAQFQEDAVPNEEGHIDIEALQAAGYDPGSMVGGLAVQIDALTVVQAQATVQDPQVALAAMSTSNEGMSEINHKCGIYNDAVGAYNTWVHSAEPAAVTEAARALGFDYLPRNLTGFTPPANTND